MVVHCKAVESPEGFSVEIKGGGETGTSHVHMGWSRENPGQMELYAAYPNRHQYKYNDYADLAKHELTHILGIKDAYELPYKWPLTMFGFPERTLGLHRADDPDFFYHGDYPIDSMSEEAKKMELPPFAKTVARGNSDPVTCNDIEMLITAWQTGQIQRYQITGLGDTVSEVLGK